MVLLKQNIMFSPFCLHQIGGSKDKGRKHSEHSYVLFSKTRALAVYNDALDGLGIDIQLAVISCINVFALHVVGVLFHSVCGI